MNHHNQTIMQHVWHTSFIKVCCHCVLICVIIFTYREIITKQARGTTRMARSRVNRRNTMDCAILNEMFIDDDNNKSSDKRSRNLLRDSEREAKRSSVLNVPGPIDLTNPITYEERAESMPMPRPLKNMLAIIPKVVRIILLAKYIEPEIY